MYTAMASGGTDPMGMGTNIADSNEQHRLDDEQNIQLDNVNAEDEALGEKRAKRLKAICICSTVTVVISLLAVVVGVLAFSTSGSKFPYVMSGGAIAGGMALIFTICPFCMYCEGKKTKTGNKMTSTFKCCIIGMLVWFSFSLCGIMVAWGMSGVWGMVECLQEKQEPGARRFNVCVDNTEEKLAYSILTFVISFVLLILMLVISCIFCCNTKAFGYKTVEQRRYELYVRNIAREEIEREIIEQRNQRRATDGARGGQQSSVCDGRHTENESYNHLTDTGARKSHGYAPDRDRRHYDNRDTERHREPSAPPAEEVNEHRDRRPHHSRNHPRRQHNNDDRRNRPGDVNRDNARSSRGQRSRRREHERRDGRTRNEENGSEAPPPSYDEVINKYLKADDV